MIDRTLSTDCLSAHGHPFCSGMRYVRVGVDGLNEYARCQCSCHGHRASASASALQRTPPKPDSGPAEGTNE